MLPPDDRVPDRRREFEYEREDWHRPTPIADHVIFWTALAAGAGVGFLLRDWAAAALTAMGVYLGSSVLYSILARFCGWQRLRAADVIWSLLIFWT